VLGALALLGFASRTIPNPAFTKAVYSGPLEFKASNAFDKTRILSKSFPDRFTWSTPRKNAALWLKEELRKLGYVPHSQLFEETIAGKKYTDLENIFAEKPGTEFPEKKIVIAAHYDVAEGTHEGAMDDASGVGIILELARILSQVPLRHSLVFLFTDSEEYGNFWGARAFVNQHKAEIIAALTLDFIAPGHQTGILQLGDGIRKGFAPLWLRELALASLNKIAGTGEKVTELTGLGELVQRALLLPAADHGAFLEAGIPAINWVGQTDDFNTVMTEIHHTTKDVMERLEVDSFALPGRAAETLIYSIDANPDLRSQSELSMMSYWKISESRYFSPTIASIFAALLFIPFFVRVYQRARIEFQKAANTNFKSVLYFEALRYTQVSLALLAGYAALLLFPGIGILTRYEQFPGTQKTPLLYSPDLLVIVLLLAAGLAVYGLLRRLVKHPEPSTFSLETVYVFYSAVQAIITLIALLANSYMAILVLLFPAYSWSFVSVHKSRSVNLILLALGWASFLTVLIYMTTIFHLGVWYWFLILSASYGLVSPIAAILFLLTVALLIRIATRLLANRSFAR